VASGKFIPAAEIKRLAEGSYEHTIFQVKALVMGNATKLLGHEQAFEVVGTFPTSALVLSEGGELIRVKFERAQGGVLKLVGHLPEEVSSYTNDTVEGFARQEIRRAVKAWKEGRVDEAKTLIAAVAPYVEARVQRDESKVVTSMITAYQASRPWKQLLQKRGARIRGVVGEAALKELRASAPLPKFRPLYDGSLNEEECGGYADLVYTDFEYLGARSESMLDLVEMCYEPLGPVVRSEEFKDEEAIKTFAIFTEDLISDLRRLHQVIVKAPKQIMKIEQLARLYDSVVEGWGEYEVAAKFVDMMSKRLQPAEK